MSYVEFRAATVVTLAGGVPVEDVVVQDDACCNGDIERLRKTCIENKLSRRG